MKCSYNKHEEILTLEKHDSHFSNTMCSIYEVFYLVANLPFYFAMTSSVEKCV